MRWIKSATLALVGLGLLPIQAVAEPYPSFQKIRIPGESRDPLFNGSVAG